MLCKPSTSLHSENNLSSEHTVRLSVGDPLAITPIPPAQNFPSESDRSRAGNMLADRGQRAVQFVFVPVGPHVNDCSSAETRGLDPGCVLIGNHGPGRCNDHIQLR